MDRLLSSMCCLTVSVIRFEYIQYLHFFLEEMPEGIQPLDPVLLVWLDMA